MHKDSASEAISPFVRGVAQSGVRIANERAVLTLIAIHPGASNADLARLSGLGPQTTSRMVAELEARGLVMRGQVLRGRRGQPATPLFLDPHGACAIAVEIGWRHFEVLLLEISGNTLASIRRSHAWPDANTIFADVAAEIATIRAGMSEQQRSRLAGIAVTSPSFSEQNIGRLGAPDEQKTLWAKIDIAGRIAGDTGLPVEWFNDGSAACWGEMLAQPGPRRPGFSYMQVGTFVGAGIVIRGNLWEGHSGNAANLGAIMVSDADGRPTYVHLVASLMALQGQLERAGLALPEGDSRDWDWPALEPVASQWLDSAGLALAKAIISTRAVIELDRAIVDGVMPRPIVERLLERVHHHIATLPSLNGDRPNVGIGLLGASAAATGAAQLLLFRRFFSRAWDLFAA